MLIAWDNKADDALIAAGSEISSLPGSNVQQAHLSQKWHTASGVKSSYLIFDMGAATACALIAVLGTNLTSAATIRVRSSDSDATVTSSLEVDTGTIAAGAKAGYGAIYKSFAETSSRYWRVDLADTSLADNLQVGRVFLGPYWQPAINMMLGWDIASQDPSVIGKSYGGQSFPDIRPQERVIRFTLDFMDEAEMFGNAFAAARAAGLVHDVLAIPDIASSYLSEQAVWGLMQEPVQLVNDKLGLYRSRFTIRERL